MKRFSSFFFIFILVLSSFTVFIGTYHVSGAGVVYYVATWGSDATGTGSVLNPWLTIVPAVAAAGTGDTIKFYAGHYTASGEITIHEHGTANQPFTITSYGSGAVYFEGDNVATSYYLNAILTLEGCDYVTISNIHFNHSALGGVTVDSSSTHVTVTGCHITNCSSFGLKSNGCDYTTFSNNYLYNNHNRWNGVAISQECISMSSSAYFIIDDNTMVGNRAENIDIKSGSHNGVVTDNIIDTTPAGPEIYKGSVYYSGGIGIYVDGYSSYVHNVTISGNEISGNNTCIRVNSELTGYVADIEIFNNVGYGDKLGYRTGYGAVVELGCHGYTTHLYRVKIYCNTFVAETVYAQAIFGARQEETYYHDCVVQNNIFYSENSGTNYYYNLDMDHMNVADLTGRISLDYNCVFRPTLTVGISWASDARTLGFGSHSVISTPMFGNYLTNLETLQTSPCIDVGNPVYCPDYDIEGDARPVNDEVDIGAYEQDAGMDPDYADVWCDLHWAKFVYYENENLDIRTEIPQNVYNDHMNEWYVWMEDMDGVKVPLFDGAYYKKTYAFLQHFYYPLTKGSTNTWGEDWKLKVGYRLFGTTYIYVAEYNFTALEYNDDYSITATKQQYEANEICYYTVGAPVDDWVYVHVIKNNTVVYNSSWFQMPDDTTERSVGKLSVGVYFYRLYDATASLVANSSLFAVYDFGDLNVYMIRFNNGLVEFEVNSTVTALFSRTSGSTSFTVSIFDPDGVVVLAETNRATSPYSYPFIVSKLGTYTANIYDEGGSLADFNAETKSFSVVTEINPPEVPDDTDYTGYVQIGAFIGLMGLGVIISIYMQTPMGFPITLFGGMAVCSIPGTPLCVYPPVILFIMGLALILMLVYVLKRG